MSMTVRMTTRLVRQQRTVARAIHSTRGAAAAAGINFAGLVGKVNNDADRLRLLNLQKTHESAKSELMGVKAAADQIDWATFGESISQQDVVADIKAAFESVTLPSASDTTTVEHPAWDADEFDKLATALQQENDETAAKSATLSAYLTYMDNLPPVTEMTVDDVLSKDATLDERIQRELNTLELHNVVIPGQRNPSHTAELDPRKKLDPIFPNTNVVEAVNAPARALAADILASDAMAAEIAKVFPSEEQATAFAEALEGTLCQAPLVSGLVAEPELDFSGSAATLAEVLDSNFEGVDSASLVALVDVMIVETTAGNQQAAIEAKASAVASEASAILSASPGTPSSGAVFMESNSAAWAPVAAKLLNVQSGVGEILAATGDAEGDISAAFDAFVASPSADGARKVAAAYSLACSDVTQTEAMVGLLDAHVIRGALFGDALKAELASVFSSEAEQQAAYASWWPASDDETATAMTYAAPFDNTSAAAADDAAFAKTLGIVQQHMLSIA